VGAADMIFRKVQGLAHFDFKIASSLTTAYTNRIHGTPQN
jgi:hypothetical protein